LHPNTGSHYCHVGRAHPERAREAKGDDLRDYEPSRSEPQVHALTRVELMPHHSKFLAAKSPAFLQKRCSQKNARQQKAGE